MISKSQLTLQTERAWRVVLIRSPYVASQQQRSAVLAAEAAEWSAVDEADLSVGRSTSGAPTVRGGPASLHLSLARRDEALLIGLAHRPVGVDLEPLDEPREPPWNVLAPAEREGLAAISDPAERHEIFLRLWTIKEATLKAMGVGLAREPAGVAVTWRADEPPTIHVDGTPLPVAFARCGVEATASVRLVWACVVL